MKWADFGIPQSQVQKLFLNIIKVCSLFYYIYLAFSVLKCFYFTYLMFWYLHTKVIMFHIFNSNPSISRVFLILTTRSQTEHVIKLDFRTLCLCCVCMCMCISAFKITIYMSSSKEASKICGHMAALCSTHSCCILTHRVAYIFT